MTLVLKSGSEPIAGYQIKERLGTGGYGEVWRAEAPGGLQKAIKFIFGCFSDEKAARELKALTRIKEVRHPFLLSIERIEVVDGQLAIVTEFADGSLKDRFQACRENGLEAIPRDELLGYLRDSADALDFLSDNRLQHLDVKPENLLVVGGRAKVADFGLLKDIHERTYSAMGGMTPVYAAPELFDGHPTAASDQYSLAIVYQEMLTGILPFPGMTAAQLTYQHLHCRPRLEPLPPDDAEIVAKALSKNPADRFPSSRALIDALSRGNQVTVVAGDMANEVVIPAAETTAAADQQTNTRSRTRKAGAGFGPFDGSFLRRAGDSPTREVGADRTRSGPPIVGPITSLPPLTLNKEHCGIRPTLFLGIGGTAGRILRGLRRRWHDRFDCREAPLFRTLLIDTDVQALVPPSANEWELPASDTIPMPLRKPQEYREDSLELLQWLSRRWLYNIPRSLQTEGLRPLGRLALIDHAHRLFGRTREALEGIVAGASIEKSQQTTGFSLRSRSPRIFTIASVSGGTGSGMVLDVAYVVRMLLADMGWDDADVCGVLLHSTQRNANAKDLAAANAYACITELNHYLTTGAGTGFTEQTGCFEQRSLFSSAYFLHLGDRLSDAEFARATEMVADYLYVDSATAGGGFLDQCRTDTQERGSDAEIQFRTFGVCHPGDITDLASSAADYLAKRVIEQLADGVPAEAPQNDRRLPPTSDPCAAILGKFKLDWKSLADGARVELARTWPESAIPSLANKIVRELPPVEHETPDACWTRMTAAARQAIGLGAPQRGASDVVSVPAALDAFLANALNTLSSELTNALVLSADEPASGLAGALAVCKRLIEHLRRSEQDLAALQGKLQEQVAQACAHSTQVPNTTKRARKSEDSATLATALASLIALTVEQKSVETATRLAGGLSHRLTTLADSLVGWRREARTLIAGLTVDDWNVAPSEEPSLPSFSQSVQQHIARRLPELTTRLHRHVAQQIIQPRGGLVRLLTNSDEHHTLSNRVRSLAQQEILRALRETKLAGASGVNLKAWREEFCQGLRTVRRSACRYGGAHRLLLLAPPEVVDAQLLENLRAELCLEPTVVSQQNFDTIVCDEGEQIDLRKVAASIAHNDPACVEMAHRLHTRVDIRWASISESQLVSLPS